MTTIIACKENDVVYLATDGSLTNGYYSLQSNETKIIEAFNKNKGDSATVTIACSGSHRLAQVVEHCVVIPIPPNAIGELHSERQKLFEKYLVNKFCTSLKQSVGIFGGNDKDEPDKLDGDMIIVIDEYYFVVESDYAVICPSEKFYGLGYSDIAIGALEAMDKYSQLRMEDKLLEALRITSRHVLVCRPRYTIYRSDRGIVMSSGWSGLEDDIVNPYGPGTKANELRKEMGLPKKSKRPLRISNEQI